MAWITDAVLREAVTAANTQAATPLSDHWDAIIPRANAYAYGKIRSTLLGRRFTSAQLETWSERTNWNERAGVLYAFWLASKSDEDRGRAYSDELKELWEELKTETLTTDDGTLIISGRVATGSYDTTDDIHAIDDTL